VLILFNGGCCYSAHGCVLYVLPLFLFFCFFLFLHIFFVFVRVMFGERRRVEMELGNGIIVFLLLK
jgi:hypothetical protein